MNVCVCVCARQALLKVQRLEEKVGDRYIYV